MATYYVGPQAAFGTGTFANPYSLSQVSGQGAFGTIYVFFPGEYLLADKLDVNRRVGWVAYDQSDRPHFKADPDWWNENYSGDYLVQQVIEGASIDGFILDANGQSAQGLDFLRSRVSRCKIITNSGVAVNAETVEHCEIEHTSSSAVFAGVPHIDKCCIKYTGSANSAVFLVPSITNSVVYGSTLDGVRAEFARNVVSQAVTSAFLSASERLELRDCIGYDSRDFTTLDTGSPTSVVNCYQYSSTDASPATYTDLTTLTDDIFLDWANKDLRLTTYGKSIDSIKAIMANLVDVPGITTDSLTELFGGGGSSLPLIGNGGLVY